MSLRGKLEIVARTHVGQIRDHNEDYISSEDYLGIAVLADGMGGMNAGEVASSMSVHLLMDELRDYCEGTSLIGAELDRGDRTEPERVLVVERAIEKANSAVFHVSQTQPQCRGMGTTVVVGLFHDNRVTVGHIGDSRMYRFREGKLEQVTKDHSFVQELIDKGLYTPEEARLSAKKNVVTRAVGVSPRLDVEVHDYQVKPGDIYLMCSDGLTDLVIDHDIETAFKELGRNLPELADHLVNVANASGGNDNISVILTRIAKPFPAEGGLMKRIADWFE